MDHAQIGFDAKRRPRREFLGLAGVAAATFGIRAWGVESSGRQMYGLITKINTIQGKRDELIVVLLDGTANMPGCLSYVIAKDASENDAIWISEVWSSKESHEASLSLPSVKESMAKGRPFIAGFARTAVTIPVGGFGLPKG